MAASKTGLREHGLALVDTVIAFHQAQLADHADWRVEVPHPTPSGNLLPDGVVLLADGSSAFVEIDRTMSYARLIAKLERYDAYRGAPVAEPVTVPATLPAKPDHVVEVGFTDLCGVRVVLACSRASRRCPGRLKRC
ncbi:replication-relaxation family protein [Streptomyces microflavus]|uniref:replication-relaxation family protein n=1 Tax=Streptomyces microflavus TaxID=1919 RepID=UPI00342F0CFB